MKINKKLKEKKKEVRFNNQAAKEDMCERLFKIKTGEENPIKNQFCWEEFMQEGYLQHDLINKFWTWKVEKTRLAFSLGTINYEGRETYRVLMADTDKNKTFLLKRIIDKLAQGYKYIHHKNRSFIKQMPSPVKLIL